MTSFETFFSNLSVSLFVNDLPQFLKINIEDPLPGLMIKLSKIKYKRSLVKRFEKTMSFRQTELLSLTDKNVSRIKAKEIKI